MSFTPAERLILAMLCDIHKHQNIQGEINSELVEKSIFWDKEWAIFWEHDLNHDNTFPQPPEVEETCKVLDMWRLIDHSMGQLTAEEKQQLAEQAPHFASDPSFKGFDANNEKHYGIAVTLVEDLGRYQERANMNMNMNSHSPVIDMYRRMLAVYKDRIEGRMVPGDPLTVDDLIAIGQAQVHPSQR